MSTPSHEQWQPGTYSEEDFSNLVMLGSETMLPNRDTRIHLHALDTPIRAAYQFRRMGITNLNVEAPSNLNLRYLEAEKAFCVHSLSLQMENGRKMGLRRNSEVYLAPNGDSFDAGLVEHALFEYELPAYRPPDDTMGYRVWLRSFTERATSWRTQESSPIRTRVIRSENPSLRTMGTLSARLMNIRNVAQYADGERYQKTGVEYTITDRTSDKKSAPAISQTSFVGQETDATGLEFKSYDQRSEYNPKTRRTRRYERREILLTPLHQKTWINRLVDPATGVPYAAPSLE